MTLVRHYRAVLLNATAALLVYGAWAVYANYEHGRDAWVMAGMVQGVYAFLSTLSITVVAKAVYIRCGCGKMGISIGFITSFIVMLAIPVGVHSVAGTPDILETILPGLIWGSMYLMGFLLVTERNRIKRATDNRTL